MRRSNPTFNTETFKQYYGAFEREQPMTLNGAVHKTAVLLALVAISAAANWTIVISPRPEIGLMLGVFGAIAGLLIAIATVIKREWAPILAPVYAVTEGLLVGMISALLNRQYPGIAIQAFMMTIGVATAMLAIYRSGWIKVNRTFVIGVVSATGGVLLFYLISIALNLFFGGSALNFVFAPTPIGILFSLFVVGLAALNLVLDFEIIRQGVEAKAPKYMEWYSAFGLTVTLVWLYLELLRLLAKLRSRD